MNKRQNEIGNVGVGTLLASKEYQETNMKLPCALGMTEDGKPFLFDLAKAPHVIIGGMPNEWISNTMHTILASLLQKKSPEGLKLVLIDARMVEFSAYEPLSSHYLAKLPYMEESLLTDIGEAVNALNSLCELMHQRYELLMEYGARNIEDYNEKYNKGKIPPQSSHGIMPYYVVMINEIGDFIMTAGKDFEMPLAKLAQLSRAVGIHIVISTHRLTSDIITGTIKANFPCRIALKTTTEKESRIILGTPGAELFSRDGDLLFMGGSGLVNIQGAYIDEYNDIPALCTKLTQHYPECPPTILPVIESDDSRTKMEIGSIGKFVFQYADPLFENVAITIVEFQSASTSLIQRKFCIGYNRAGRLMDMAESAGIVSPPKKSTYLRDVLITDTNELMRRLLDIKKEIFKEAERNLFKTTSISVNK